VSGESIVVVTNLTGEPVADVRLSLADGPLCGTLAAAPLLGATSLGIAPPVGTANGGLDDWPVGDLGPHKDLIVQPTP
jgi:hypothetical protein